MIEELKALGFTYAVNNIFRFDGILMTSWDKFSKTIDLDMLDLIVQDKNIQVFNIFSGRICNNFSSVSEFVLWAKNR